MESLSLLIIVSIITALISLCGGFLYLQGSKLAGLIRQSGPFISAVIAFLAIFAVIMPEVSAMIPLWQVIVLMLISLVLFFMLERLAGRYHARSDTNTIRNKRQIFVMNLIDSIRSILDGVVIGVSFASGLGFGITAATVTAAHEIPQEVGDFAIMKRYAHLKNRNHPDYNWLSFGPGRHYRFLCRWQFFYPSPLLYASCGWTVWLCRD